MMGGAIFQNGIDGIVHKNVSHHWSYGQNHII